jgi:hypothetical protein
MLWLQPTLHPPNPLFPAPEFWSSVFDARDAPSFWHHPE